jgi:hypothetical protein
MNQQDEAIYVGKLVIVALGLRIPPFYLAPPSLEHVSGHCK